MDGYDRRSLSTLLQCMYMYITLHPFTILIHVHMYTLTYIYISLYILIIRILYTRYITHSGHTCTVDIVTAVQ